MGSLRSTVLATNAVLIVLSLAAIACRLGRKALPARSLSWPDALIALAAFCAVVFSTLLMVATRFGLGMSNEAVSAQNMRAILKLLMAWRLFYFLCNWTVKHSLLLFYATLTVNPWSHRLIYFLHFVAFAFGTTCICVTIFQCRPIHKSWDGAKVPGSCVNWPSFNYFNSSFMLTTDAFLYAIPLIFTWNLRVSRPQRIAVNMLFALGGLVLAASGMRAYFVHAQATHPDFTRRNAMTTTCAAVENHLAIIVACAPSIKVVLLHYVPRLTRKFEDRKGPEIRAGASSVVASDVQDSLATQSSLPKAARSFAKRTNTDESGKTKNIHDSKWWKPPNNWEVSTEGREECSLGNTFI